MNFDLKTHTVLFTIAGSRAYGTNTKDSDVDIKGVAIAPMNHYLGFLHRFDQADKPDHIQCFMEYLNDEEMEAANKTKLEGTIYDIQKFFHLAADANPNILDILFCRDEDVRVMTRAGKKIRDNRQMFLSKKAKHTFSGYAMSQLKRIETHRKWLISPPVEPPTRAAYGLTDSKLIPMEEIQAAENAIQKKLDSWEIDFGEMDPAGKIYINEQIESYMKDLKLGTEDKFVIAAKAVGCSDNFVEQMKRERVYRTAKLHWKQFNDWKKNRNPARAELEKKYGLDVKHASHLVRLFSSCREILTTGTLNVYKEDAQDLRDILNGKWSYDDLVNYAKREDDALKNLYETSALPHSPDREKLNDLCVEIISEYHETL
jgi:predicted nucleotidyltransferase